MITDSIREGVIYHGHNVALEANKVAHILANYELSNNRQGRIFESVPFFQFIVFI